MANDEEFGEDYTSFTLSAQHNGVTGGFSELSKAFKDNPTIEHYLELRRQNPGKLIEVATNWSLDWVFANEDRLTELGIEVEDVVGSLDADEAAASRLSLRLIELLVERRTREASGDTHLVGRGEAIADSLVNYLIAMMLDALDWTDRMIIPRDLIVLIKHQLRADVSIEARNMEVRHNRHSAVSIGAQLIKRGEPVSLGIVAKIMNVERSTVMRWFKDGDFLKEVEEWHAFTEAFAKNQFKKSNRDEDGAG
jgi:predicted transcriptional regulator